jgi:hypothetical protein
MDTTDLFRVETVEKTVAPAGMEAGSWCRYVITSRRSRVVGRYRGTLAQTRRNAEQLARSINERAQGIRSAWAPRPQGRPKTRVKAKSVR